MNHGNLDLVCWLVLLAFFVFPLHVSAQGGAATVPSISPSPLIRLTGVLEARQKPQGAALPLLSVWIAGKPWLFRVAQVEPIFSSYRAAEKLRKVSVLGLRFLAESPVLRTLQNTDVHDRPIVIEGWLRPKAGVLHVRSVRVREAVQDKR